MARLWATRALHGALDWVVGRPLYLVDFHCFAIPQRRAPTPTLPSLVVHGPRGCSHPARLYRHHAA